MSPNTESVLDGQRFTVANQLMEPNLSRFETVSHQFSIERRTVRPITKMAQSPGGLPLRFVQSDKFLKMFDGFRTSASHVLDMKSFREIV